MILFVIDIDTLCKWYPLYLISFVIERVSVAAPLNSKGVEQPKIIEKYVEKQIPKIIKISKDKIIKEPPDYNNIPEEIIQREIKKRQVTAKETRMNMRMENTKRLSMNIA